MVKTHTDKTSADKKEIGFEYQYYFFLWKLLSLEAGESVGLEVKDDVHTELDNDIQIFYQVKHTLQKRKDGEAKNLNSLDPDLWKTLFNWAKIISDPDDGRSKQIKQLDFTRKTSFVLFSNKSSSEDNIFQNKLEDFKNGTININDFRVYLKTIRNTSMKKYSVEILKLSDRVLEIFLFNISFELNEDEIFKRCQDAIKSDKIPIDRVNDVFSRVDSAIRRDNFIKIKEGKKVVITFDEYYQKYRRYYEQIREQKLIIQRDNIYITLPDHLEEQTFIKQILEIEDIETDDLDSMGEFTKQMLIFKQIFTKWLEEGDLTQEEYEKFSKDAINSWRNKYRRKFRKTIDESKHNELGQDILDDIREEKLVIQSQALGSEISNGVFYGLSDVPQIGWRKDWEKYKNEG